MFNCVCNFLHGIFAAILNVVTIGFFGSVAMYYNIWNLFIINPYCKEEWEEISAVLNMSVEDLIKWICLINILTIGIPFAISMIVVAIGDFKTELKSIREA